VLKVLLFRFKVLALDLCSHDDMADHYRSNTNKDGHSSVAELGSTGINLSKILVGNPNFLGEMW